MSRDLVPATDKWSLFLETLAGGTPLEEALQNHQITSREVSERTLNPQEATRFFEAQAAARRRSWKIWDIEEVARKHATGMPIAAAIVAVRGTDLTAELFEILETDKALAERFATAERIAARVTEQELLDLADDKSGDVLETPKGPIPSSAAVGRSKLQVETRLRLKLAQHRERYTEKAPSVVAVGVNINLAEQLERAINRGRLARKAAAGEITYAEVGEQIRQMGAQRDAIDAQFAPVQKPAAPAKSDLVSTIWREEPGVDLRKLEADVNGDEPASDEPKKSIWD